MCVPRWLSADSNNRRDFGGIYKVNSHFKFRRLLYVLRVLRVFLLFYKTMHNLMERPKQQAGVACDNGLASRLKYCMFKINLILFYLISCCSSVWSNFLNLMFYFTQAQYLKNL